MIRVGTRRYSNKKYEDPKIEGYKTCVVLTPSTEYGSLGPYALKNEKGQIMENIWQGSKIYKKVPETIQRYSRYDDKIIWEWGEETHIKNGKIQPEYWNWRSNLMNNKYAVRYPLGYGKNKLCQYAIKENADGTYEYDLGYIEARKKIYCPIYCELVKKQPQFEELKKEYEEGTNILIIDVDGPREESKEYYKEKYGVEDDFIENNTIEVNRKNMRIMLNDEKHPFGHGYCLGCALKGKDERWLK
jgi:hypothetical protein